MKHGDKVTLNALFETYEYKDTWVDEAKIYDGKPYKIIHPQRDVVYEVVRVYGKEDQWIVLKGINAAFPAKFFETNTQHCKIKKSGRSN